MDAFEEEPPLGWLKPKTAAEHMSLFAAQEQHEAALRFITRARSVARERYSLSWTLWFVTTLDYDGLWSVVRGRTPMTLTHRIDLQCAEIAMHAQRRRRERHPDEGHGQRGFPRWEGQGDVARVSPDMAVLTYPHLPDVQWWD